MLIHTWLLYLGAVLVLTATPGPSILMCVTNGVHYGARRTLFSACGSVTAVLGIMVLSTLGLSATLAASRQLFELIKWLGVAYLLYLGVSTLRSSRSNFDLPSTTAASASGRTLFFKGVLVGASNPKALLFFSAFFPQFINSAAPQLPQFFILGATFVCLELCWLTFYATFASRLAPWLRAAGRASAFNRLSGAIFIGAAVLLASLKRAQHCPPHSDCSQCL